MGEKYKKIPRKHYYLGYAISFMFIFSVSGVLDEYFVFGRDFLGPFIAAFLLAPPAALVMCMVYNEIYTIKR
jgi:hypothetical protein